VSGTALWYFTRSTGLVSLVLLTISVVLGLLLAVRWRTATWPRFMTTALHRNVSLLVVAVLGIHIGVAVLDGFAPIGWLDVVVPFRSAYRPVWIGMGAVAVDLLLAVVITSALRRRIGNRAWKLVHWSAYACWPVAVLHGLGTGTDAAQGWSLALTGMCLTAVLVALWCRLASRWTSATARTPAFVASIAVPLAIAGFAFIGPLQPGWASRAGTPTALLGGGAGRGTGALTSAAAWPAAFTAQVDGTIDRQAAGSDGKAVVTINGTLRGEVAGVLHVELAGRALSGGGVAMTSGTVTAGPPAQPTLYQGTVIALAGSKVTMTVSAPDALPLRLVVELQTGSDGAVAGVVTGSSGASVAG
jgi:hypothetical protein